MKKTMLPIMFLTFLLLVGVLSGCSLYKEPLTDGYLEYVIRESKGIEYVAIVGIAEEGKQQKVLVIPPYIKGMPVKRIGLPINVGFMHTVVDSGVLEKIFIPAGLEGPIGLGRSLKTVVFCNTYTFEYIGSYDDEPCTLVSYLQYEKRLRGMENDNFIDDEDIEDFKKKARIANIEFLLNYDEGLMDIFWIDYEPANSLITKWFEGYYTPEREGYTFAGWYKEPECINEWNFETDRTPAEVIDEETGEPVLQITRLYANWIEKW